MIMIALQGDLLVELRGFHHVVGFGNRFIGANIATFTFFLGTGGDGSEAIGVGRLFF